MVGPSREGGSAEVVGPSKDVAARGARHGIQSCVQPEVRRRACRLGGGGLMKGNEPEVDFARFHWLSSGFRCGSTQRATSPPISFHPMPSCLPLSNPARPHYGLVPDMVAYRPTSPSAKLRDGVAHPYQLPVHRRMGAHSHGTSLRTSCAPPAHSGHLVPHGFSPVAYICDGNQQREGQGPTPAGDHPRQTPL